MKLTQRKNVKFVFKSQSNTDVLIELFGIKIQYLPITLDPLECKHIIRHLNDTNKKILNNVNCSRTFTHLADHYIQEKLEKL